MEVTENDTFVVLTGGCPMLILILIALSQMIFAEDRNCFCIGYSTESITRWVLREIFD